MTQRILRFSPHQTAKTMAFLYLILSLPIVPIFWLAMSATGHGFSGLLILILPLCYAGLGYVFVALGCLLYNWSVGITGGVEVDMEPEGMAAK
jgi:hypothetical protein